MEAENKVKRWKKYLEQLYNGNLGESVFENEYFIEKPNFIEYIKDNKASRINKLPIE